MEYLCNREPKSPRFSFYMRDYICTIILCILTLCPSIGNARRKTPKDDFRDSVLTRIYNYSSTIDTAKHGQASTYNYTKFQMRTNRRNATLLFIPTMYTVARTTGRHFFGETYSKLTFNKDHQMETHRLLNFSTIPHRRNAMTSVLNYLTPNVYGENLFQGNILSPFHRTNRKYYRYFVTALPFGKAQVYAYPRFKNTQLVRSRAIVDAVTGQINILDFEGEHDMTNFFVSVTMNAEGRKSLYPEKCDLRANFRFMGNQITGMYTSVYGLPKILSDSLNNVEDTTLMAKVRPIKLTTTEQQFIEEYYKERAIKDSINQHREKKSNFVKDVLWDIIGDNVLNRIKQNFGSQNQGFLRISPILNPLYMGYSHRKGFVYKFDVRGSYHFSDDVQLALRFKSSYSFKRHLFYFSIPATLNYNQKHNGFLQLEVGNGNRINSNVVARRILDISEQRDSALVFPYGDYTEFKDTYLRVVNHWMFTPRVGFELGLVGHHRTAVVPEFYREHGFPSSYRSVAPAIAIEWHPTGTRGPVFKVDYERSIKGFLNSNISYERVEMDVQSIIYASRRRSYSLRLGSGFYTVKGDHWDFVDYTNFRDNNIPGGWNDDWSGEFEMLNAGWYNASDYYVRANSTYEAPVLFTARLPLVGRYIENERLYVNALLVRHLHPYTEWGYGFTTRAISLGFFAAFKNAKFDGIGCKFGFELFRNW